MTWNSTVPADNGKIRLAPSQITANWSAIDSDDTSLSVVAWNFANQVSSNPSAAADMLRVFCKQDASSNKQLYFNDDTLGVNQIWSGNFKKNNDGYIQFGTLLIKWGRKSNVGNNTPVTYDATVPFKSVYTITASRVAAAATSDATAIGIGPDISGGGNITGFSAYSSVTNVDIQYIAIGSSV